MKQMQAQDYSAPSQGAADSHTARWRSIGIPAVAAAAAIRGEANNEAQNRDGALLRLIDSVAE